MEKELLSSIGKIIERDSKTSTYKFALLRGTIEIALEHSPHVRVQPADDKVAIPFWLLIEKWLFYYYPIFAHEDFIPQLAGEREHGKTQIAFRKKFAPVIEFYRSHGGFSSFAHDLQTNGIPTSLKDSFIVLCDDIEKTIKKQPMRYLGRSVQKQEYSIFNYEKGYRKQSVKTANSFSLLHRYGAYYLDASLYEVFKILGGYLAGDTSLVFKWAEFTQNLTRKRNKEISAETVIQLLHKTPVSSRDTIYPENFYARLRSRQGYLHCVWSGKKIGNRAGYHIDHLLPFAVLKNNDFWNLMPCTTTINSQKSNKIPSPQRFENAQNRIREYWAMLAQSAPGLFHQQLAYNLTGTTTQNWQENALEKMIAISQYLIEERGFEAWEV